MHEFANDRDAWFEDSGLSTVLDGAYDGHSNELTAAAACALQASRRAGWSCRHTLHQLYRFLRGGIADIRDSRSMQESLGCSDMQ